MSYKAVMPVARKVWFPILVLMPASASAGGQMPPRHAIP